QRQEMVTVASPPLLENATVSDLPTFVPLKLTLCVAPALIVPLEGLACTVAALVVAVQVRSESPPFLSGRSGYWPSSQLPWPPRPPLWTDTQLWRHGRRRAHRRGRGGRDGRRRGLRRRRGGGWRAGRLQRRGDHSRHTARGQ